MRHNLLKLIAASLIFSLTNVGAQDARDVQFFLQKFSQEPETSDFNQDGRVDTQDLLEFIEYSKAKDILYLDRIKDPAEKFAEVDRLHNSYPELIRRYQPELYDEYLLITGNQELMSWDAQTKILTGDANVYAQVCYARATSLLPREAGSSTRATMPQGGNGGDGPLVHFARACEWCVPFAGSTYGRGMAWPKTGPIDWDSGSYEYVNQEDVCLFNLGDYNDQGQRIGPNEGVLDGRHLGTTVYTYVDFHPGFGSPDFPRVSDASNDFRFNYEGDPQFPATEQEAVGWSSEVNTYHHTDTYRRTKLNWGFLYPLGFDQYTIDNLLKRQYRPDLEGLQVMDRPILEQHEYRNDPLLYEIFPFQNGIIAPFRMRWGDMASLPPLSKAYDPSLLVGEYAGLAAFWVIGDPRGFPGEGGFGENWNSGTSSITQVLNDALNVIEGMRYTGEEEVFRYYSYATRIWEEIPCDGIHVPCGKGKNLNNVMMFDENNDSKNMIFPFSILPGMTEGQGPGGSDLSAMYFGGLFRDLAFEAGLGITKAAQIYWRLLYLVTDRDNLTMRQFGSLVIQAARDIWPSQIQVDPFHTPPGNPGDMMSMYEDDIVEVLTSRGIPTYGRATFQEAFPAAIGSYPETLEYDFPGGFGSSHPESHPGITQYGGRAWLPNGYIHPEAGAYTAYQTMRFGNYGPCDELQFTDGTFDFGNGTYNGDGTYYEVLTGREMANKVIMAPGNYIRWNRLRARCDNENEGNYTEDVRPLGFRSIKATSEGFSFEPQFLGMLPGWRMNYQFTIADPSYQTQGGHYTWTFTTVNGEETILNGFSVQFAPKKDEPFTVKITRTRDLDVDELEIRTKSTGLDPSSHLIILGM